MNVLLLTSHAIAEHDDLDMFTRMGVACYSIGGAYDDLPFEGKRPALPNVIRYPDLEDATARRRATFGERYGDPGPNIDWGKAQLAPEVIDWADTIIVHHFPEQWIGGQWQAIRHKRVIWRTCGQSDPRLESVMYPYTRQGLQIVRYSPKEAQFFSDQGAFAGEDALIRFGKDPDEWCGWTGDGSVVDGSEFTVVKGDQRPFIGNITQHMAQRGDACGYPFWKAATEGLEAHPAGPGSEILPGGIGELDYDTMRTYLRVARVYLYTGTRPASYTLGLIEAMMTGTPVVVMPATEFSPPGLFESDEIAYRTTDARTSLRWYLKEAGAARFCGEDMRARAIDLFGLERIMGQWADFLA